MVNFPLPLNGYSPQRIGFTYYYKDTNQFDSISQYTSHNVMIHVRTVTVMVHITSTYKTESITCTLISITTIPLSTVDA